MIYCDFKAKDSSNSGNLKRPSKLLTKHNSLDSKEVIEESGQKADSNVAVAQRTAITPSAGQEAAAAAGKQGVGSARTNMKPKINHHSINPSQQASELDASMGESGSGGKSAMAAGPPLATAKKLQPALSTSFSSNQLNSVKSVQNSQFDSSRSGSITSIMYAKSKLSSGYR